MSQMTTVISRQVDLNEGLRQPRHLPHQLVCGNDQAHEFRILCTRDGETADLTGAVCMGYVRRADGVTIPVEGSISGNMAAIVLPAACYQVPGHTMVSIDLQQDGVCATHAVWTVGMESARTEEIGGEAAVNILQAMTRAEAAADRAATAGGASAWYVTIRNGAADRTLAEVVTAHQAGHPVLCRLQREDSALLLQLVHADADGAAFTAWVDDLHWRADLAADGTVTVTETACLTGHQDVSGKLDASALPEAVQAALAQAKASGEFDGADGVGVAAIYQQTTSLDDGGENLIAVQLTDGTITSFKVRNGRQGSPGEDGYTPVKGVDYADGAKGDPGVSPTVSVSKSGKVTTVAITDADGTKTASISDGEDGRTPVKGTDYFTAAEQTAMVNQVKSSLGYTDETWTFTLADGSTVTKRVVLG